MVFVFGNVKITKKNRLLNLKTECIDFVRFLDINVPHLSPSIFIVWILSRVVLPKQYPNLKNLVYAANWDVFAALFFSVRNCCGNRRKFYCPNCSPPKQSNSILQEMQHKFLRWLTTTKVTVIECSLLLFVKRYKLWKGI